MGAPYGPAAAKVWFTPSGEDDGRGSIINYSLVNIQIDKLFRKSTYMCPNWIVFPRPFVTTYTQPKFRINPVRVSFHEVSHCTVRCSNQTKSLIVTNHISHNPKLITFGNKHLIFNHNYCFQASAIYKYRDARK